MITDKQLPDTCPPDRIAVRVASVKDIQIIRELARISFCATYMSIISKEQIEYMMQWMYSEETLRRELAGNVTYLLLELEGKAVGYVSFGPESDATCQPESYHLHKIYLLPEVQHLGLGTLLFRAAEERMREAGASFFELNVNRHNPALSFYKRMGMKIARSGDFEIGEGFFMNDYILRKDL